MFDLPQEFPSCAVGEAATIISSTLPVSISASVDVGFGGVVAAAGTRRAISIGATTSTVATDVIDVGFGGAAADTLAENDF